MSESLPPIEGILQLMEAMKRLGIRVVRYGPFAAEMVGSESLGVSVPDDQVTPGMRPSSNTVGLCVCGHDKMLHVQHGCVAGPPEQGCRCSRPFGDGSDGEPIPEPDLPPNRQSPQG